MYVVAVDFKVKPENIEAFMSEMIANARASVEHEPGCSQFDVCVDPNDKSKIFLYEIYDDRAAFEAHLATAHFKAFDRVSAPWLDGKAVRLLERVCP